MITYRSSATATTDAGFSLDLPVPAGVQSGDFLVAHLTYKQGTASVVTPPAGWTVVRADGSIPDSGGVTGFIYTRVATSSEPAAYTFTFQDYREAAGGIIAYAGVKTAMPIDVTTVGTSTSTTTPTSPSIDTVYTQPWLLWFLAARDNASTDTASPPSGMTERWRLNPAAPGCVSLVADQIFSGPGSSGAKVGTLSPSAVSVAQALFLSPADESPNHPPVADAGPNRVTEVGTGVVLDGTGSHDVDPGDTLTYAWTHVSGLNDISTLSDVTSPAPTFTPTIGGRDVFRLTVTDAANASSSSTVTIDTTPTGVRATVASGLGTVITAPIPATAQAGDVAFFAMCSRPNGPAPVMNSSGWSAITRAVQGGSSTDVASAVFMKRLTAGDLGTSVSATIDNNFDLYWTAQVVAIRGLHATHPQTGVIVTNPVPSPHQYINSVIGGAGTASYDYTVTAIDAAGETVASTITTVANAPNTLSNTNYVQVSWGPPNPHATSYNIYGRSSGSLQYLATVSNANITGIESDYRCGYNDMGVTPTSQVPPTQQPIGLVVNGLGNDIVGTPMPERLYASYANAKVLVFTGAQLVTPAAGSTVTDPSGFSPIVTSQSDDNAFVLHSALMTMSSAGDVGVHVFTPSDYANSWATAAMVLRPLGANGPPTARAGFDQVMGIGETVYLDASDSFDDDGDDLTYHWTQLTGPTVRLSDATAKFPSFVMPSGTVSFRLTVTDPDGLSSTNDVGVTPVAVGQLKVQDSNGNWVAAPGNTQ